jgi:hypothetical protein
MRLRLATANEERANVITNPIPTIAKMAKPAAVPVPMEKR